MQEASVHDLVRNKVHALIARCGYPDETIEDDDVIPETGLLDSAAIIELVIWIEGQFNLMIEDDEVTLENLGSINRICAFVSR